MVPRKMQAAAALPEVHEPPKVKVNHRELKTLGERVRTLRASRGETLTKVADGIGVSKGYLSSVESGRTANVGSEVLTRIARYFQCSADFLLGLDSVAQNINAGLVRDIAAALIQAESDPQELAALRRFVTSRKPD